MFRTVLLVVAASYVLISPVAGQEWTEPLNEDAKLLASESQIAASLGFSIAVIGDIAVLSAHGDDDVANNAGAFYVFRWSQEDGEWAEGQKLTASDGAVSDLFGFSLSMSGDMILVSAPLKDGGGPFTVFRWSQEDGE